MNTSDTIKRWLNVTEATAYLGCSRNFLDKDRVTRLHGIRFTRLGRHVRYDREDLDAFLEAYKEDSTSESLARSHELCTA